jgi:hypothetical protein
VGTGFWGISTAALVDARAHLPATTARQNRRENHERHTETMDELIVVGTMALFYFHVQSDGVTVLVAFALITVILPFVTQQILVALGSPRTPFERDDYRTSWLGVYGNDPAIGNFLEIYVESLGQLPRIIN